MKTSGTSALKSDGRYTVADYKSWTDDVRRELIDGVVYEMSPAPRVGHQELIGSLFTRLNEFLEGKPCRPFIAPIDVYPFDEDADEARDVVQPDVVVVCDESKIREDGVYGAPDFVAEVLSPSTAHKDLGEKRDLYERAGVREYWLLNPDNGAVLAWRRAESGFAPVAEYGEGAEVPAAVLPGFVWKAARARKYGAAKK